MNIIGKGRWVKSVAFILALTSMSFAAWSAQPALDFRSNKNLSNQGVASYTLAVDNCSHLAELQYSSGAQSVSLTASDANPNPQSPLGCQFPIELSGAQKLNPSVSVTLIDGAEFSYQEQFIAEDTRPDLQFHEVAIESTPQGQYLITSVVASDDTDISYIGFSVSGIRASDLRNAGGIVNKAKQSAFARTDGVERVYPVADNQSVFSLSLPLQGILNDAEIARDALVLADVYAVDAFGNQTSFSKIAFTGDSIEEQVLGISAVPENIIFSNPLETAVVVPTVSFEFRGLVPLPGVGTGVNYSSSHPDLVAVTPGGVVYPLRETGQASVNILVSYRDLDPLTIPVEVDFTKTIVSLKAKDIAEGQPLALQALNTPVNFPEFLAVFNDGSEADVGQQLALQTIISDDLKDIIHVDGFRKTIKSQAVIPEDAPASIEVRLKDLPEISLNLNITAKDAVPDVKLNLPARISVGDSLIVKALAKDDVGIEGVRFYLNGSVLGERETTPYEITLPINEAMTGQMFTLYAEAIDTVGQKGVSQSQSVTVSREYKGNIPAYEFEYPVNNQRFVEKSRILYQISHRLGILTELYGNTRSGIERIEYFSDDLKVAESLFAGFEIREELIVGKTEKVLYEVWRAEGDVKDIAVEETSTAITATIHVHNNTANAPSKLIRIVANQEPSVRIIAPVVGGIATVKNELPIRVEVTDDTLDAGTTIEVYVDGERVDSVYHRESEVGRDVDISTESVQQDFTYFVAAELLGETLDIEARAIDYHQEIGVSQNLRIPVKADQLPTVAISHPTEGASFVSGLPMELRASASDDINVGKVDFYVDEVFVGADTKAPFSVVYETPIVEHGERQLSIHAVAFDSIEQSATSQTVQVTLGQDEERPVVNVVSPVLKNLDGQQGIATVSEQTEVVFKVAGYDNVAVTELELKGFRLEGERLILTGKDTDIVPGESFKPEAIPGGFNGFSAFRITDIPAFLASQNSEFDDYTVSVAALDEVGNKSEALVTFRVIPDGKPLVKQVDFDSALYYVRDQVNINVFAEDDKIVDRVEVEFDLPGQTITKQTNDAVKSALVDADFTLDLAALNLANVEQTLTLTITAYDSLNQASDSVVKQIVISKDEKPPVVVIDDPSVGQTLYQGAKVNFSATARDNTYLQSAVVKINGESVATPAVDSKVETLGFSHTVATDVTDVAVEITLTDEFSNQTVEVFTYDVEAEQPPQVVIRTPTPGSRLYEGEQFSIAAFIEDDKQLTNVDFYAKQADTEINLQNYSGLALQNINVTGGHTFSINTRVPNLNANEPWELGVRATDNTNLTTTEVVELDILDDEEAPFVTMEKPDQPLSVLPSYSFEVNGEANDNFYIDELMPVLIAEGGEEIALSWENLIREDRIESIEIPDPITVGKIIVAERFYTNFEGKVVVDESLIARTGETFRFLIRAADKGINETDSNAQNLTIEADANKPEINFLSPLKDLVERQSVAVIAELNDELGVESYNLYVAGNEGSPLASASALNARNLTVGRAPDTDSIMLDLSQFTDIPAEGLSVSLVLEATDISGNEAVATHVLRILPDQSPLVGVQNLSPAEWLRGGAGFHQFILSDDFITHSSDLNFLAVYTSFSQMTPTDQPAERAPRMEVENLSAGHNRPYLKFNYPEAQGVNGKITIGGDVLLEIKDDAIEVNGLAHYYINVDGDDNKLKLDFGTDVNVSYKITGYSDDACIEPVLETTWDNATLPLYTVLAPNVMVLEITPIFSSDTTVLPNYVKKIRVDLNNQKDSRSYKSVSETSHSVTTDTFRVSTYLSDYNSSEGQSYIATGRRYRSNNSGNNTDGNTAFNTEFGSLLLVPDARDIEATLIFGLAADRFSNERDPQTLIPLALRAHSDDTIAPVVEIESPTIGENVVPAQRLEVDFTATDNSEYIKRASLLINGQIVHTIGGAVGTSDYRLIYDVPQYFNSGSDFELSVVVEDAMGNTHSDSRVLLVDTNEVPTSQLTEFTSGGRSITDQERLSFAEFWVRSNSSMVFESILGDDAGLKSYQFVQVLPNGERSVIYEKLYNQACPSIHILRDSVSVSHVFDSGVPVEYESIVTDTLNQKTVRRFLVHPQQNVTPAVRITSPADNQSIVAGTFTLAVGIVQADDRPLPNSSVEFYANNIKLSSYLRGNVSGLGGSPEAREQAFNSIYDEFEKKYGQVVAREFAYDRAPNSINSTWQLKFPTSLIDVDGRVSLVAKVTDADGAVGTHKISVIGVADTIYPEVLVTEPEVSYSPIEAARFDVHYRGYDNVKVDNIALFTTYGARKDDGKYVKLPYGDPVKRNQSIADLDHEIITTVNIDTPIYKTHISVDRLGEIAAQFVGQRLEENPGFDIWLKVVVQDAQGLENVREVKYRIREDERPVVDIVKPLDGDNVVENNQIPIQVTAFDDVGIQQVRLIARNANNVELTNVKLNQAPYNFAITLPDYQPGGDNRITITVEAMDTYGAVYGDLDVHQAEETITVNVVEDQPPVISIALPTDGEERIEGEKILVQVNAIDDVGIERVILNANGLISGDKSFSDSRAPFEFILDLPYGQAGKDITLSATVTEYRLEGEPRVISTVKPVTVHVLQDTTAPELVVNAPLSGATIVEKRILPFSINAEDNVSVNHVRVALGYDRNQNTVLETSEIINDQYLMSAPYAGVLALGTLETYLGVEAANDSEIDLKLLVSAFDGAGNVSTETLPVTLRRNAPPTVNSIRILDRKGNLLVDQSSVTQGREILVEVIASDDEAGVEMASLYQAVDVGSGNADNYQLHSQDGASPFQFVLRAPQQVGAQVKLKAKATDVDGYQGALSDLTQLLEVVADLPPEVAIVQPANDESVIIDGEPIEVFVEAIDDLGEQGIDRVVVYVNSQPMATLYNPYSETDGAFGQESIYHAVIYPRPGSVDF